MPSEGELESTINELEESNRKLAILKAERDGARGATFPVLNRGGKQVTSDKTRDKQRDLQDMEATLRDLLVCLVCVSSSLDHKFLERKIDSCNFMQEQSTSRLHELKHLHEDRLNTLRHLSNLQVKIVLV